MRWNKISTFQKFCKEKNDDYDKFKDWAKDKQIDYWVDINHFRINLKAINKNLVLNKLNSLPPLSDHVVLFKSSLTNKLYYTFQPYFSKEYLEQQMQQWSMENNIEYIIHDRGCGWHNGQESTLVEIVLK